MLLPLDTYLPANFLADQAANEMLSRMTWDAVQSHKSVADALRDATEAGAVILADYVR